MAGKSNLVDECFPIFNCAQTVLSLYSEELGITEETALKISSGFGGGMNCAETCGAVTGSYMVIGMRHGNAVSNPEAKAATKQKILEFNERFKAAYGSLICKELTGYDISTPEGNAAANAEDVFRKKCPHFVKTACDILEEHF